MTFKQAVLNTPSVCEHYSPGLQALKAGDRGFIDGDPRKLTGSINLDVALVSAQPNAPRWDYGIGVRRQRGEVAVWVEVHPASSTDIKTILKKLDWLRDWLQSQAPALERLTQDDFHWIATGGRVAMSPNSPQSKQILSPGCKAQSAV